MNSAEAVGCGFEQVGNWGAAKNRRQHGVAGMGAEMQTGQTKLSGLLKTSEVSRGHNKPETKVPNGPGMA